MRLARAEIFDPSEIVAVHAMARTNRRCFLLGQDPLSGKNFDHRKRWIEDRLQLLASCCSIDLLAFTCLSNHIHLVLRSRPDVVQTWDDTEVARRWWTLCPKRKVRREVDGQKLWFPAEPNEFDLNAIRAALAETLETSDYTSVQRRIASLASDAKEETATEEASVDSRCNPPRADEFLSPVAIDERNDPSGPRPSLSKKRCSDKGFLAMTEADYLTILDWLARNTVASKRGSTPADAPAIFDRLGIDSAAWSQMVKSFGRSFKNVAGKPSSIAEARSLKTHRRFYCSRV